MIYVWNLLWILTTCCAHLYILSGDGKHTVGSLYYNQVIWSFTSLAR